MVPARRPVAAHSRCRNGGLSGAARSSGGSWPAYPLGVDVSEHDSVRREIEHTRVAGRGLRQHGDATVGVGKDAAGGLSEYLAQRG